MKYPHVAIIGVLLVLTSTTSGSQPAFRSAGKSTSRFARPTLLDKMYTKGLEEPKPGWVANVAVGGAYTDAEDGSLSRTTPFVFEATNYENKLKITGDGYTVTTSPGTRLSGFADPTILATHYFLREQKVGPSLEFGGGITIPVGGDVGSKYPVEQMLGVYTFKTEQWELKATAALLHTDDTQRKGHYGQDGSLQALYNLKGDQDVVFQIHDRHQNGANHKVDILAEYDFPLGGKWSGSLSYVRGLTRGSRDDTLELDINYKFGSDAQNKDATNPPRGKKPRS